MEKIFEGVYRFIEALSQTDAVDRNNFDIKKEYDYLNRVLFDNELPKDLKFEWMNKKQPMGQANLKRNANKELVPTGIALNDRFEVTYEQMLGILAHEMVHTYFQMKGRGGEKDAHGSFFRDKVKELNNSHKVAFSIPGTESIDFNPKGKQNTAKLQIVRFISERGKPTSIAVFNPKLEEEVVVRAEAISDDWFKTRNKVIEIYKSAHPDLQVYPSHTKYPREWKNYVIKPLSLYDEIKKDGVLIKRINKHVKDLPSFGKYMDSDIFR